MYALLFLGSVFAFAAFFYGVAAWCNRQN